MAGRSSTFLSAALLAAVLGVLGASMPVPLVALGPGPTYDTLGDVNGAPVVTVDGLPTFPTSGHLNMTTVAVSDRLTFVQMLRAWASGDRQVVPRSADLPARQDRRAGARGEHPAVRHLRVERRARRDDAAGHPDPGRRRRGRPGLAAAASRCGSATSSSPSPGARSARPPSVSEALAGTAPGQNVTVTYRRDGQEQQRGRRAGREPGPRPGPARRAPGRRAARPGTSGSASATSAARRRG